MQAAAEANYKCLVYAYQNGCPWPNYNRVHEEEGEGGEEEGEGRKEEGGGEKGTGEEEGVGGKEEVGGGVEERVGEGKGEGEEEGGGEGEDEGMGGVGMKCVRRNIELMKLCGSRECIRKALRRRDNE